MPAKGQSSLRYILAVVVVIVIVVATYVYFQTASKTIIGVGNNTTTSARCGYKECATNAECEEVCGPMGVCGPERRCVLP